MDINIAGNLTEPSVWRFVLFVVAILIWVVCCIAVSFLLGFLILRANRIKAAYVISSFALLELTTYAFLIIFLLIFTGSAHLELFAVLIAVSTIGYIVAEFMWLLVCPDTTSYINFLMWSRSEMTVRFPRLSQASQVLALLPLLIYPVWIGIGYFGSEFKSGAWEKYVIKVTLVGFIGLAWLLQMPNMLYVMISKNTASAARTRVLLNQFAQTPSILLLVSVFMWTSAAAGETRQLFGGYFIYSQTISYFVVGYVTLILLLPFIVGHFRTRAWLNTLIGRRGELSRQLADQLRQVNVANSLTAITVLRHDIQSDIAQWQAYPGMQLANSINNQSVQNPALVFALPDIQKYDPVFIHLRELDDLIKRIDDVNATAPTGADDKEKREILRAAADAVEKHSAAMPNADAPSSAIIILLSAIFSGVAAPVVASVGKWLTLQLGLPG